MKVRILSIDGGGIRGIIPATILVRFESFLKEYSGNQEARIADYFDLIAGTSTGSILASTYLCPVNQDSIKAKYSATDALDFYLNEGKNIFKRNIFHSICTGFGLLGPKYSAKYLEDILLNYLGECRLTDLVKPCLIPSYDVSHANAMFFNQKDSYLDETKNFYVKDIVRGSAAAPVFFPPAPVVDEGGKKYTLIDGGVFANNPALCAYIEVCKFKMKPSQKDIMILSLGTGAKESLYPYKLVKKWGGAQWIMPLISIFNSSASETVDHQLKTLYHVMHCENQYLRIEKNLEELGINTSMDNVSQKHINLLKRMGEELANEYEESLRLFAKKVVQEEITRGDREIYKKNQGWL
ncbi:MAG: patatin-like phospholipase family protein [Turicibacter sp.]